MTMKADNSDRCAKNSTTSPLLKLPIKIRERIWDYALSTPETIELLSYDPVTKYKGRHIGRSLAEMALDPPPPRPTAAEKKAKQDDVNPFALLLVSRQIYLETSTRPFSLNTVHCNNFWDLGICLRRFSEEKREAIHTLKIRWESTFSAVWDANDMYPEAKEGIHLTLEKLSGLEKIVVDQAGQNRAKWEKEMCAGAFRKLLGRSGLDVVFEVQKPAWKFWQK
jgi:hypothetical protein